MAAPSARRRPRRRPGRWQGMLGILLILAVLLVVADRVAAAVATDELQDRLAGELASRQVSYTSLDVAVEGTPFLTQVAASRYESITIGMTEVRLRSGDVEATLPALDLVATGVRADALAVARGDASVTADRVVGTALVSYAGLGGLVDLSDYFVEDIGFAERDGALYASATVGAVGVHVPIEVGAEVAVRDGQIQVRFRDVRASGLAVPDIALPAVDALANAVIVATVPPLPFGITVDALTVTPRGLVITATGRDVILAAG